MLWNRGWLGLAAGLLGWGGAIVPSFTTFAFAQSVIVPDNTLKDERSGVVPLDAFGLPVEVIDGGAQRGQNLFHSFREFNVNAGRGAYFAIPNDVIRNVLARVTGGSRSEILGTLGTFRSSDGSVRVPGVNLFLINPNGIVFGPNASLDVGGSFFATTADAVQLGEAGFFSASQPASSNLLSVNPSAFLFNAIANQNQPEIVVRSQATTTVLGNLTAGLRVPNGQSLILLGGYLILDGGRLLAQAGRVELGGLAAAGTVELAGSGSNLSLNFPNTVIRSNVSLTNQASVNAANGGDITINAEHLDVLGNSIIGASKIEGFGTPTSQAGAITLNIAQSIIVANSFIGSSIDSNALGDGSNILIRASSLTLRDGAQIIASTRGQGNAGNVTVFVTGDVTLDRQSTGGFSSGIFSDVSPSAVGEGGDVLLLAGSLSVTNGAQISASTSGSGNAGNLEILVRDDITLAGVGNDKLPGGIFSAVLPTAVGSGGNISLINGGRFLVKDGAQVSTSTFGQGNAGNLEIIARDAQLLIGTSPDGSVSSGFRSSVERGGVGNGGNLTFITERLEVREGARISTGTSGVGNAGNLTITSFGSAGFQSINDSSVVTFDGQSSNGLLSGAFSNVGAGAVGDGGTLNIAVGSLSVTNGAQINAGVEGATGNLPGGRGNGGSLQIQTLNSVNLSGVGANGIASGLLTSTGRGTIGSAGEITLKAGDDFRIANGAIVSVSSLGSGNAGRIAAEANSILMDRGKLTAESTTGKGGDIQLRARNFLFLRRNSLISAVSGIIGSDSSDGNIDIAAKFIVAIPSENSDIVATGFGRSVGSNVQVTAQGILGLQFREQPTPESDILATGNVTFNAPDTGFLQNSLIQFPQSLIDTNNLLSSSCIVRRNQPTGSFFITGSDGLPERPGTAASPAFPTGEVQNVAANAGIDETDKASPPSASSVSHPLRRSWKIGDPIAEPDSVYQLPDGQLVLSHACR